jgi:phage-related protein
MGMDRPLEDKPLVWLKGGIKSPPFTDEARLEAGTLLRRLQNGEQLAMPHSRPMPSIGPRCHELRVDDGGHWWRVFYRIDSDAIVIADVLAKTTRKTPKQAIENARARFKRYDTDHS